MMKNKLMTIVTLFGMMCMAGCKADIYDLTEHQPSIALTLEDAVSTTGFKVHVKPNQATIAYEYALGTPEDGEAFRKGTFPKSIRVDNGDAGILEFKDLQVYTDYVLYAKAFGENETSGSISMLGVRTAMDMDAYSLELALQYVTDNSAGITLTCTQDCAALEYYFGKAEDRAAFEAGTLESTKILEYYGFTANCFDLKPNTEYVFFARAYDRLDMPSRTSEFKLKTSAENECPSVDFVVEKANVFQSTYLYTPNALCGGILVLCAQKGKHDSNMYGRYNWRGDIIAMLRGWREIKKVEYSVGPLNLSIFTPDMETDYEMESYIALFDKKGNIVGVKKVPASTPAYDKSLEPATVEVTVSDYTDKGATYNFKASDNTLGFYFDTVDADWYDEFKKSDSQWHENYLRDLFRERGYEWRYVAGGDPIQPFIEGDGKAGQRLYVVVCPLNANGTSDLNWGKANFAAEYTIPAAPTE